jgi:hypothetical protein
MAGSIKGIIVEIGGDTSGLQKSLSKVNSATSSLSKELKGINSLLKLDPKNTELLSQKQASYNELLDKTKDKIKQLEDIRNQAIESEVAGNKISEENWRNLQREIISTQLKLKQLESETTDWSTKAGEKIEVYGSKIINLGNRIDNLGTKFTTRLTLPMITGSALIATSITKSAMVQETAIQQVDRIYGDASKTIKDFAENSALSYNMATKDAYKYAQVYGNLIQTITDDQLQNADYTQQLLKASSVIASATGRTMEDVMDRIRSGLLGNTEAIEDLGVNVNVALLETTDTFKKLAGNKGWKDLDFKTQQQIRLFGILEQTTKKYGDTVNQNTSTSLQKLTARVDNLGSKLGTKLLPIANKLIDKSDEFVNKLDDLDDAQILNILKIGLMVAAAGPLIKVLGTTTTVIGGTVKGIGLFSQAIAVAHNKTVSANDTVNKLAKVFVGLTSPVGIAATVITASVALITYAIRKAEEETRTSFENIGKGATDFVEGIATANSHLDTFNTILFATNEEQQKLQENMVEVQKGITDIAKKASDERRDYTQDEIVQLDEYFTKLREIKNRELEIQTQIAGAITQQAKTVAETHKGSLEEYKVVSQEWIKTAQDQADKEKELINNRTIEEIALLNTRYGAKATMENTEYAREYNSIVSKKEQAILQAQDEVAKVNSVYSQGYLDRSKQNDGFYVVLQTSNQQAEDENKRHTDKLNKIQTDWYATEDIRRGATEGENARYNQKMKDIWKDLYSSMNDSQEEQLGAWLGMISQTELYGGKIDEETKKTVDSILASYDSMPQGTRDAMKNAMQPMLEEMEKKEPSLFAKATSIASGILSKLKTAFNIHSPSRETRGIFKNVMLGAELGLEDEEKKLYNKVNKISSNLLGKFRNISSDLTVGGLSREIVDKTKTVFTTPNIVINTNDLSKDKMDLIFNDLNRRFGSKY